MAESELQSLTPERKRRGEMRRGGDGEKGMWEGRKIIGIWGEGW